MPVNVVGLDLLKSNLRRYDKDMAKVLDMTMKQAMSDFVHRAQSYVPGEAELTNWNKRAKKPAHGRKTSWPVWRASQARSGIKAVTSRSRTNLKGFISMARVENTSRVGAIYETAGRKNPMGQMKDPYVQTKSQFFADKHRGNLPWEKRYYNSNHKYSGSNNPRAGQQFIEALPKLWNADPKLDIKTPGKKTRKFKGRLIFRSLANDNGRTIAKLMNSIEVFNKRLGNRSTVVKKVA